MSQLSQLRIAVVSRGDSTIGGAGRVADELCDGLAAAGHTVHRYLRRSLREQQTANTTLFPWQRGEIALLNAAQVDLGSLPLLLALRRGRYDVVHFHDYVMAWGTRTALRAAIISPAIVTFHDYSGFTGGCMYPQGCEKFENGCGGCPQVGSGALRLPLDRTRSTWALNARLANSPHAIALAPSRFVAQSATRGAWRGQQVSAIPNAVDVLTFSPARRPAARELLGLVDTDRVVVFVAAAIGDPRKGLADLVAAMRRPASAPSGAKLWLVGDDSTAPPELPGPEQGWHRLGKIADKGRLAGIYAAADLLVVPSLEDNFPCTIAESLASGTPVVGYPTGGIPEMFDSSCGRLAASQTPEALGTAIEDALRTLCNPEARAAARAHAEREFSPAVFVERHVALYREALARFRA